MASDRHNFLWTLAHIGLGFLCTLTPFVLIIWFYLVLFTNFFKANSLLQNKKPAFFFMLFSYLISFELLDRMSKTSPYLPFEIGKYFLVFAGILGIWAFGVRYKVGIWMAILLTPAVFYDFSGQRLNSDIIFSYLGPLAVGLLISYAHLLNIFYQQFNQILKLIWLGCLSSLIFTYVKTPDLSDIYFGLKANSETTGGGSSNQVATILGLGMFLSSYSLFTRLKFSGYRILDILILFGFTFQGLLSFSRGGIFVGLTGILILLFFPKSISKKKETMNLSLSIIIIVFALFYGVFEVANNITGGNLLLRYQGETEGTMRGTKEVTLNHFVTGRVGIFEKDIILWKNNFFSGVGVGGSRFLRDFEGIGTLPHIELSRLLAEHGILGFMYALLFFIIVPLKVIQSNKNSSYGALNMAILAIAILTTFHAAMRTGVTPLFILLGSLKISESRTKI
jgi:hypothetical protein